MKINLISDKASNLFFGPILLTPEIFFDERGYFLETWNEKIFNDIIKLKVNFVQDNESFSRRGTLRGLHYQLNPFPQGKLIRVIKGEIYDVLVDLRKESKTFAKWAGIKLDADTKKQIWIPQGFAHGFLTLSEEAIVGYKVTNYWDKNLERTLYWKDDQINIKWPSQKNNFNPKLSEKDQKGELLKELLDRGDVF